MKLGYDYGLGGRSIISATKYGIMPDVFHLLLPTWRR